MRRYLILAAILVGVPGCQADAEVIHVAPVDAGTGGSAGSAGDPGTGGASSTGGAGGSSATGGTSGSAGTGGTAGAGGTGGSAGTGEAGGTGGDPYAGLAAAFQNDFATQGTAALAVVLMQNGVVTWSTALGQRTSLGGDALGPMQTTTLNPYSVLSPLVTMIAALQLVDKGDLDLDAPVVTYIPEWTLIHYPEYASVVTTRQLMDMSSGLPHDRVTSSCPGAAFTSADEGLDLCLTGTGNLRSDGYFDAPPGRLVRFSADALAVLALVVERVSGEPFRTYVRDRVLLPLGMDRSYYLKTEVEATGEFNGAAATQPAFHAPTNGLTAPATDIAKLGAFLLDGDAAVLSDTTRAAMLTPSALCRLYPQSAPLYTTLGLFRSNAYVNANWELLQFPFPAVYMNWDWSSSISALFMIPDEGVVLAWNSWDGFTPTPAIWQALTGLLGASPPSHVTELEPSSAFGKYVGTYPTRDEATNPPYGWAFTVSEEGQTLKLAYSGPGGDCDLEQAWTGFFKCPTTGGRIQWIRFELDANNQIEYLISHYPVGQPESEADAGADAQ